MTGSITWPTFIAATYRLREATQALGRLIADTLAAQYEGAAAYLVLQEDGCCGVMGLVSVLDANGGCLFEFGDDAALLPGLPPGSPLADLWDRLDPAEPWTLFKAVQGLYQAGSLFDLVPYGLPLTTESAVPENSNCLLLSTAARPDIWDFDEADTSRLVRPYSAPRPPKGRQSALPIQPAPR